MKSLLFGSLAVAMLFGILNPGLAADNVIVVDEAEEAAATAEFAPVKKAARSNVLFSPVAAREGKIDPEGTLLGKMTVNDKENIVYYKDGKVYMIAEGKVQAVSKKVMISKGTRKTPAVTSETKKSGSDIVLVVCISVFDFEVICFDVWVIEESTEEVPD